MLQASNIFNNALYSNKAMPPSEAPCSPLSLALFPHNKSAYHAAMSLMASHGKAAIIHPTGTGKSFIAFYLAAMRPTSRICWLLPSEYIYKTQLENVKKVSGGYAPCNINALTYAKLLRLSDEKLAELQPEFIVLDEFHRCGAAEWGKGVQRFLLQYPSVPILGLSATNIRYLDGLRNMSDELFDGHVASEISLGDALVRGILTPPTYVLSLYSYQQELERYEERVNNLGHSGLREESKRYVEILRRSLAHADGLEDIFAKHIKHPTGKYIAFCSGFVHLESMMAQAKQWFARLDTDPHFYAVYSENPQSSSAFRQFKKDSSAHIKVLFCIDMLNEGIHLDDISGVILFRPTISPIIYKQQIGRALSASSASDAVIFDIVNNADALSGIASLQDEMDFAVATYTAQGQEQRIVNKTFRIIDEVQNCRELFLQLDQALSGSWEIMFAAAQEYAAQYGNLRVHANYKTPDGLSLGAWLVTQRRVRAGKFSGILTSSQIARLDALGMVWESKSERLWQRGFAAAEAFYAKHGHLNLASKYRNADGFALGGWIQLLRTLYAKNNFSSQLNAERVAQLNAIGMVWNVRETRWEQYFSAAQVYVQQFGNLAVPVTYATQDGIQLGRWLRCLRYARAGKASNIRLTEDQIERLNAIGMEWGNRYEIQWQRSYRAAQEYAQQFGTLQKVPAAYRSKDSINLNKWLRTQRATFATLSEERKTLLKALPFVFEENGYH